MQVQLQAPPQLLEHVQADQRPLVLALAHGAQPHFDEDFAAVAHELRGPTHPPTHPGPPAPNVAGATSALAAGSLRFAALPAATLLAHAAEGALQVPLHGCGPPDAAIFADVAPMMV